GDVLGITIENILFPNQAPPLVTPQQGSLYQSIGYGFPTPVLDNGTIVLPLIEPIDVRGMSLSELREAIIKAYTTSATGQAILGGDQARVTVTMARPRTSSVLVVRQDSGSVQVAQGQLVNSKKGVGQVLELPAYENDVLTAITRSGGTPGSDAKNEVIILRGG